MKNTEVKKFNPLVSIVIPVYNGSNFLREAIDSALFQTYKNIEIIVVNDGSTDNTEEIVRSYGSKLRYFQKENGGVSTALNLGIKKSNGEYISWLSHDDMYYSDKIEKQINLIKNIDKNTILYGSYKCFNKDGTYQYDVNLKELHGLYNLNRKYYPLICGCLNGCTMLIPKNIFKEIGYFNKNLKTTQDYDMWFRVVKSNLKLRYSNEFFLKSRIHNNQTSNKYKNYIKECDDLWISIINFILKTKKIDSINQKIKYLSILMKLLKENKYNSAFLYCKKYYIKINKKLKKKNIKEPLVSVIIPSFNQGKYLARTIDSVKKQTYKNIEIIIVDDGSTDIVTKKKLKELENTVNIFYKKNGGLSSTRNYGLNKAKGEYIQFLDSDDWLDKNKIKRSVVLLQNNRELEAIYTKYKYYFEKTDEYVEPNKESLSIDTNMLFDEFVLRWQRPISIPIHCYLFHKYLFKEIKFNTSIKICEDWYMWLSLAKKGLVLAFDDYIGCVYRVHDKSMMNNDRKGNFYKIIRAIESIRNELVDDFFIDTYDESMATYIRYLADIFIPVIQNNKEINNNVLNESISDKNIISNRKKFFIDGTFKNIMIIYFYKIDKLVPKKIRTYVKKRIDRLNFIKKYLIK